MEVIICDTKSELGHKAATVGAETIRRAIESNGQAGIILATGASQFEVLDALAASEGIAWGKVTGFHLDEYAGLPMSHPASFRRYLRERFLDKLPQPLGAFHFINGEGDCDAECRRLNTIIADQSIALAFVGIGENGHLAFNDPPADFETETPYIVVDLDDDCRRQQLGEGWFPTLESVPKQAISMSIRQILKSERIICSAPDTRKAKPVRDTLEGPVTPLVPASILQRHPDTLMYLDSASAALLEHRGA
ncbi:MAG: glucosamine-6-phosphate deaminase [Armatimonadota bacterium]|nr:glucosamine-6-phosphate deaminase [Armatimonadota bacterium]